VVTAIIQVCGELDDVCDESHFIFGCGSTVAATTALVYDLGEQDYTYGGNIDVPIVLSSTDTRTRGGPTLRPKRTSR
jgi:hypothetical protein